MEILVRYDAFDSLVTRIGGDVGMRENTGRIEDIQALIFHRAHVEVINGNNIEKVEVVLQTIHILIPSH